MMIETWLRVIVWSGLFKKMRILKLWNPENCAA